MQCLAFGFEGRLSKFLTAFLTHFVTLFLVDFGDEVTKILCNSLFSFGLAHLALLTENIVQKITRPKWRKTKNEVTKRCDEPGKSLEIRWIVKSLHKVEKNYQFWRINQNSFSFIYHSSTICLKFANSYFFLKNSIFLLSYWWIRWKRKYRKKIARIPKESISIKIRGIEQNCIVSHRIQGIQPKIGKI